MDPTTFASALPGPSPSGPNLEYDPDFLALERAQQGRPEQVIGDAVKPGEDPNWPDVKERAEALLGRTRDLRVAMTLTRALLQTDGFTGLATGLGIIRALLEGQWDTVHPQLDAEDHNDPTSRINSLMGLAATDGLLKALREAPVVSSPTLGRFTLRDIRIAYGKQPVPAGVTEPPQPLQINAAFREASLESLESTAAAVSGARGEGLAINSLLTDKVGAQAPELKPLLDDLTELSGLLAEQLRNRGVVGPLAAAETPPAAAVAGPSSAVSGEVSTRADVVRQLERICEYYQRHEPSSPIPLLLQRAKRLVSKDFMTIIRDLAPSGLAEVESIGGVEKNNE
jgi:type VI secretion system protein ImpA